MRISYCTFSSHLQWSALHAKTSGAKFHDAPTFFDYARSLGADAVQTGVHSDEEAEAMHARTDATGGGYEGDVPFPKTENDIDAFAKQLRFAHEAGAKVARTYATANRRYESMHSLDEFKAFAAHSEKLLGLMEPVLRKQRVRLALENHKDRLVPELIELLHRLSSEWIGVNVDTGNNMSLLEEPHAVVEALAPFAASVHLKDMAVQAQPDGFLLSEVVLGTGCLDLPRMIATLRKANPDIFFNLEMATRDPLRVPCLTPAYWTTFPDRSAIELAHAMTLVKQHPPSAPPPMIQDKTLEQQLAFEEANNRACLDWMRANIKA